VLCVQQKQLVKPDDQLQLTEAVCQLSSIHICLCIYLCIYYLFFKFILHPVCCSCYINHGTDRQQIDAV